MTFFEQLTIHLEHEIIIEKVIVRCITLDEMNCCCLRRKKIWECPIIGWKLKQKRHAKI